MSYSLYTLQFATGISYVDLKSYFLLNIDKKNKINVNSVVTFYNFVKLEQILLKHSYKNEKYEKIA